MEKITEKKEVAKIALLFSLTYMVSYITRINYGAIISEMELSTSLTRDMLSLALTGSFITYGFGQIISGICGDRFSPKKLVSMGLIVTIIMNIMLPLFENVWYMLGIWCVNGLAQSFMWPPFVRLLTEILNPDDYKRTVTRVSWGSSIGTIFVYLISPLIIAFAGWKAVFLFSALCGIVMLVFWNKYSPEIENKKSVRVKGKMDIKVFFTPVLIFAIIAVILQGMLKDGVTTWLPTYISETYNMSNLIAILSGVILPIFNIFAVGIGTKIYVSKIKNPFLCAAIFYMGGVLSSGLMMICSGRIVILSILGAALITGCMHGVNLMFTCMLPPYFAKNIGVSTVSGIFNCCSYIGTAISTYGFAVLSKGMGWNFILGSWLVISLVGGIICFISINKWKEK